MDLSDLVHGLKPKTKPREGSTHHDSPSKQVDHWSREAAGSSRQSSGKRSQQEMLNLRPSLAGLTTEKGGKARKEHHLSHLSEGKRSRYPNIGSSSSSPSLEAPVSQRVGGTRGESSLLRCELCSRVFESKSQFDQHTSVFHRRAKIPSKPREAAFPCPYCGKAFTSPSKRNVHQNATHMGLRPFQCTVCGKSFGYKGDLTKHMATHSGIKAHSCYICGAKFARNFYVKRHIETVHEKKTGKN